MTIITEEIKKDVVKLLNEEVYENYDIAYYLEVEIIILELDDVLNMNDEEV